MRDDGNKNEVNKTNLVKEDARPTKHLALCPLDGRYSSVSEKLENYFSEYALVKNRTIVEVCWLRYLIDNIEGDILDKYFNPNIGEEIYSICSEFSEADYFRVKEIESKINHDVKAVELFVAEKLQALGYEELMSHVHIGCTSEDITNTAYGIMIDSALKEVWIPMVEKLMRILLKFVKKYKNIPMLAHTHGQPATPTTVGKEMLVFVSRLERALNILENISVKAKFNGATGNYSAISVAYPDNNWIDESMCFIETSSGWNSYMEFNPITTQIESHDYVCNIMDSIRQISNIVNDLNQDMWLYISKDYFKLLVVKEEVGSSTMPHKVNPIKFENSEGNIVLVRGICSALSDKLPCSRMQRDLSDSSVQRNIGLAFGYSIQAIEQTIAGLKRVEVNTAKLEEDLNERWEVLAEPIQTMLRKYGIPDAYEQLKKLTRGKKISKDIIKEFVSNLDALSVEDKNILLNLTPSKYVGYAERICDEYLTKL